MYHSEPSSIKPSEVIDVGGDASIRFRRFRLLPRTRRLFIDEQPVDLGSRAFDLLMVLIKADGKLVTKTEILARVWPDTVVEESNLQVQVSALRKVLSGDRDVIRTIPGRGYMFAVEDSRSSVESDALIPRGPEPSPPPLAPAPSANLPAAGLWPRAAQETVPDDKAQPTVVVIDDDENIREALGGLLRSVGLRVELFGSVQEFLDSARSDLPGCLVLDIRLPGRSGLDFHDDLVKANMDLPVIFISGHADVPMSVRAMKAGAVEFLTKPVRHQDLLDAIRLAIDHDRARRSEQQIVARLRAGLDTPPHQSAGIRETTLRVGPLELDLLDRTAKRSDRSIQLLPREFQLLEYMMRRRDQILSRAILLKEIWNYRFVPETKLVDVHMGRLRHKVDEPQEAPMIQNVRGVGFILSAPK
jgi:DNA-binding response OmpR family regulator